MGVTEEVLWRTLEQKAKEEDARSQTGPQTAHAYLAGIKAVCEFGVNRAKTIRDHFPMYTLHDEVHICNVLRIMAELLGDQIGRLTRDEAAMLILAACCHDVGMSCSDQEKTELLENTDRLARYLENHHSEYVKAYAENPNEPRLTDEMLQKYLRSIHHERAAELLSSIEWPEVLWGKVDRDDLIRVCRSHGESVSELTGMENTPAVDICLCAVLLRLADILDFDTSRAPKAVYDYSGLDRPEGSEARVSKEEWQKHMASQGFDFLHVPDRKVPYDLPYHAKSSSMQIEQTVNSYLDWVDRELNECGRLIRRYSERWRDLILPSRIKRTIKAVGYVSGQYHLTMDQDQIMELLVGKELYSDPSVFVRELIQNAIDAVRTREQLDRNLPKDWKPQIHIRSWMDEEGYHWFRIEDNGTGMTQDIIENHFLKIGSSYYTSDTFQKEKIRCQADPDYMPISRFGIGILSCFMGGEESNQVEVSTKRFRTDGEYPPALRLSMHGMSGYYYLASQAEGHSPAPMKGKTDGERRKYLQEPGTAVAVRTNLYQTGKYTGFKEIVDRYVIYPSVPIHYDGAEGSFDYATKEEFMEAVHAIHPSDDLAEQGVLEIPVTEEHCRQISQKLPGLTFRIPPKVILKCAPLDRYTESPYLSGAALMARMTDVDDTLDLKFGEETATAKVNVKLVTDDDKDTLFLDVSLNFSDEFQHRMELLGEKCRSATDFSLEVYEKLLDTCGGNWEQREILDDWEQMEIQSEIIRVVMSQDPYDPAWQQNMCSSWPLLSEQKLHEEIREIRKKYQEITGRSLPSEDELKTYRKYDQYNSTCMVLICKLRDYPWYRNYFSSIFDRALLSDVVAHNGILCGDSGVLLDIGGRCRLGAIILLQDKYRPGVDVARLGIRELSLETACDLVLIQTVLNQEGFGASIGSIPLRDKPWMIPEAIYRSLLIKRPDLGKRLLFKTNKGYCGHDKLKELMAEYGRLQLNPHVFRMDERNRLLYQLQITYLKQRYGLYVAMGSYLDEVYITERGDYPTRNVDDIFPAAIFLCPKEECEYLMRGINFYRYFCNAEHRFSKFLLNNGRLLHQKVPGILKELIRVLQEEKGDSLVQKVNNLLLCLRSLPGQPIPVPDDVFLTPDDLRR